MRAKMGLLESQPDDETLVHDLLSLLQGSRVDYTRFFRELGDFSTLTQASPLKGEGKGEGGRHSLRDWFLDPARFDGWAARYGERLRNEHSRDEERRQRMNRVNPKYVLRNYLAQTAIEKAQTKGFFRDRSAVDPRPGPVLRTPRDGIIRGAAAELGQAHHGELLVVTPVTSWSMPSAISRQLSTTQFQPAPWPHTRRHDAH